jgi:hypothetical protein
MALRLVGNFKKGSLNMTDKSKLNGEIDKIVIINTGDDGTNIYRKSSDFKLEDLKETIRTDYIEAQNSDKFQNFIATYGENENGDITVDLVMGKCIEGIICIAFMNSDNNLVYHSVLTINKSDLLFTSAYLTVKDVLEKNPELRLPKIV